MKKTYQSPAMNVVKITAGQVMQVASPSGVQTGGAPHNEYSEGDVSYGRRSSGFWEGDED